jgi:bifunctional UDP-N-acetylglucosamine pyrophosphorylase/glucosamine-1-phosphate N-acetyltransferase
MKAVFLCGGSGKRMFPITEDKFLLDFLGKSLLQHQIQIARASGLKHFVVIGHPENIARIEQITTGLSEIKVKLALQKEPLGIANALESASEFLDGDIILVNPNDVFESSAYNAILAAYKDKSADSYILGYKVRDYFPGGYLVVDEESYLKHIVEKPEVGKQPSDLVNIMVHLHTDSEKLLEHIKKVRTTKDDAYECGLENMAQDQHKITVVPCDGFWQAIKYPWHIFKVVKYFLDRSKPYISPSAHISQRALIEGKVIIGDNVRVLENAVIRGPAYIGPDSVIGNNVLVRDYSHIGANCVVGYATEVKASYIGNNCWFHSNYIGDSIIGNGCSFGAGTVLANLRFDEGKVKVSVQGELLDTGQDKLGAIIGSNSRTGINASVMPGIKVGPNSFVGPHVCLTQDLDHDKIILPETGYKIMENTAELDAKKKQELMRRLRCVE